MTETTRIRWEPTEYGGFTGHVGTLEPFAFQVWQTGSDYDDVTIGEWVLSIGLPGPRRERLPHGHDPDKLKTEAEQWLERFVSSLGAVFPDEPAKPRPSRAWHADWAPVDRDQDGNAILRHKPTGGLYRLHPVEES